MSDEGSALESVTLPVGGMTCASCVAHVEGALKENPGVSDATVSLMTRSATVKFARAVTTPEALVEAVRKSGYTADLPRRDLLAAQRADDAAHAREARSLVVRALLLLGGMVLTMFASMPLMTAHAGHAQADPLMAAFARALDPPTRAALPWLYRLDTQLLGVALLVASVALVAVGARTVFLRAWSAARHKGTDMNTLVALGALAGLGMSAFSVLFPHVLVDNGAAPDVYFEGVLGILGFVLLGQGLEARARKQTTSALAALASLEATRARIETEEGERDLPIDDLRREDLLVIRPGERVPADSTVEEGSSSVDEAMLTGESAPVKKERGARLVGGTVNGSGVLKARVSALGDDSVVAKMVRLMRDAQARRAPIQHLADRVSAMFVPSVMVLSALTLAAWLVFGVGGAPGAVQAVHAAVAVLVVACPCAMGLAVPTAVMVATGVAARRGVVLRGGDALQRGAGIDTIVFDKTGTLTVGHPVLVDVVEAVDSAVEDSAVEDIGATDAALALAAAVEKSSEHPLARALVDAAASRALKLPRAKEVRALPGAGVEGMVEKRPVQVLSIRAATQIAPLPERLREAAARHESTGATCVVLIDKGAPSALFALADALRDSAAPTVAALRAAGVESVMLTGDRRAVAEHIAKRAGIATVHAETLPADKVEVVRALKAQGKKVAMVGDGVNDAAALAAADLGVALASGTDVAREASDVTLMRPDLAAIPSVLGLSRAALSTMKRNLLWAAGYNVLAIPVAMGVLVPLVGVPMSPVIASLAMAFSSVSVVLSSLWLARFR
ncbi:MAG: heavy metal translocating P-type ATPase [Deltaproteobacteria bacterium]|nr:heavy metal translocating P-type ATPase [Deltaproteobacteria bacterium]